MDSRIVQFQMWDGTLFVLDAEGTLWNNTALDNSSGWRVIPGPTIQQHKREDLAIMDRIRINISKEPNL
jgi:hypothetical protein